MNSQDQTVNTNTNYSPVYVTLNASNNPYLVAMVLEKTIEEASEYPGVITYLTINSGNPPQPPICPPGQHCQ